MSPPKTPEIPEKDIYQFLEETPPAWVIAHWGELAQTPRCPLDIFHANPRFFLSWMLLWEKTAQDLFLPWEVTQAWESLCLRAWPLAVKTWEPETLTRWIRLSNLWDRVQEKLFDPPDPHESKALEEAKGANPGVPWDLLRREFEARREAEIYADDNSSLNNIDTWQSPTDIIPAEVWPRASFCMFEYPEALLNQIRKTNTDIDVRRARLIKFCKEAKEGWEKEWIRGAEEEKDEEDGIQNLRPQTPPKKIIFQIEGELSEIEPAPEERRLRRDLRSYKWIKRGIIRVPGPATPSGTSWEQIITSLLKKTEFTVKKRERLEEAAQKLNRDWNSLFSEADQMALNFLQFIARTGADQRMRDDPIIYLKVISIALNVIGLLEKMMPPRILRDAWLQSTWEKIFGGKASYDLSLLKLIEFIIADGLNIPPKDVGTALQNEGIRPTPFPKEEFLQFCQSGTFEEHQDSIWTTDNPDRREEGTEDAEDKEEEQEGWRGWDIEICSNLEGKLAEAFSEEAGGSDTPTPVYTSQLAEWARGKNFLRRWEATLDPLLPADVQAELATHWDFAARLSLAANPNITPKVLEQLARDVQPSVRVVALARVQRGTARISPLVGEILTPGEILWLLVGHPKTFFEFGSATYGDGSDAYAQWDAWRGAEGEIDEWAYFGGLLFESGERGLEASHIALHGLSFNGCGRYPCMYLGTTNRELTIQSKPTF